MEVRQKNLGRLVADKGLDFFFSLNNMPLSILTKTSVLLMYFSDHLNVERVEKRRESAGWDLLSSVVRHGWQRGRSACQIPPSKI